MPPACALLVPSLLLCAGACADPVATCRPGQEPSFAPLPPLPGAGLHAYTHSHNDYAQRRPLDDALEARFYSIEADVRHEGGRFEVSHSGFGSRGTLETLYLAPLQRRVAERGSVHGDGLPFHLWLDLKGDDRRLDRDLEKLLGRYDMLARFGEDAREGPVVAVLTGHDGAKRRYMRQRTRHALRDSNEFSLDDPADGEGWGFYALEWGDHFGWDGSGEMPREEQRRLGCLVENVHALKRRLRLYATPDNERVWRVLVDAGVDFVQTDRVSAMSAFFDRLAGAGAIAAADEPRDETGKAGISGVEEP